MFAVFTEELDKCIGIALCYVADIVDSVFCQMGFCFLADSPEFSNRKRVEKLKKVFLCDNNQAVRLFKVRCYFCGHHVRGKTNGGRKVKFFLNSVFNYLTCFYRRAEKVMTVCYIQEGFVYTDRFYIGSKSF